MQSVLDHLDAGHDASVAELCDYVRIPSVSAQPAHSKDMAACAKWLAEHCKSIGLKTRLAKTPGNPVVIAQTPRTKKAGRKRPHFLVYGHYDVQPPEPFDLWKTEPFSPTVKGSSLIGRGASDNKGQHFAHLKAVEAYLKSGTELPCDITFIVEGEEEVGSEHLADFLKQHKKDLACDAIVISDNGIPSLKYPTLTYGLRGVAAMEVRVDGPSRDLHSGIYGGSCANPAMVLSQLLGSLQNRNGKVTVPGFYDDVLPLSRFERDQFKKLPHNDARYKRFLGVKELFGEKGFTSIERCTSRPTLEINGLTSGYQGEGSKTIVPAWASAKITCRLVPNQKPQKLLKLVAKHLKNICPPTVRLTVELGHAGEPYLVSPESPFAHAALRAMKTGFGREPLMAREGGSIPIVNDFKKILGVDTLLLGLGLPDDNIHSPNEKFDLDAFRMGKRMSALLWSELSNAV